MNLEDTCVASEVGIRGLPVRSMDPVVVLTPVLQVIPSNECMPGIIGVRHFAFLHSIGSLRTYWRISNVAWVLETKRHFYSNLSGYMRPGCHSHRNEERDTKRKLAFGSPNKDDAG